MSDGPSIDALLRGPKFTSIYADWLGPREQRLASHFRALTVPHETRILLLNATKGVQFYPSIVDFFALLQRTQPKVRITSASYFEDEIFELSRGIAKKGVDVVSVSDVTSWSVAELNRFDVVLAVGPSEALAKLIAMRGLTCSLVCLDLAFYHQVIDGSRGAFLRGQKVVPGPGARRGNRVICYSCQPEEKVFIDLSRAGFLPPRSFSLRGWADRLAFDWRFRWFNYIPVGFTYRTYYASDEKPFDVALLGTSSRRYGDIDPSVLRGRRVLFIGRADGVPDLDRLRREVPMTVVSGVDEDTYARLLALCRCVVIPTISHCTNVFLSVIDALASGTPLVTTRQIGLARLEGEGAPIAFYGMPFIPNGAEELNRVFLSAALERVLGDEDGARDMGARGIAFAKERLDIHAVLETILREEVLPSGIAVR